MQLPRFCRIGGRTACSFMLSFLRAGMKRDAGYQRNALPNRRDSGVHPLVCGLSVELPPPGRNDGGARGVCRPFLYQPLGDLVIVRQVKYLNNIVEQDHRFVKRIIKPMLNFKLFRAAKNVLAGIELSFADQFYVLSGQIRPV